MHAPAATKPRNPKFSVFPYSTRVLLVGRGMRLGQGCLKLGARCRKCFASFRRPAWRRRRRRVRLSAHDLGFGERGQERVCVDVLNM
jgi:hypothetical protein